MAGRRRSGDPRRDHGHKRKDETSKAIRGAEEILLKSHGDRPRANQNRLLFLVPEVSAVQPLRDNTKRLLAWESIVRDADQLNLDKHHEKEAIKSRDEAAARVEASLREAYRILLAPMAEPDAVGAIVWEDEALNLSGSTYEKAIAATVKDREWVISGWAPMHLGALLARWFWKEGQPAIGAKKVWLDTCRYLYLPRLASEEVFIKTMHDGIEHRDWFGYAANVKDGVYSGMLFGNSGSVYLDEHAVLMHPDAARASIAKSVVESDEHRHPARTPVPTKRGSNRPSSAAPSATFKRFHVTVNIDKSDPIGSFTEVVENVVQHMSVHYGTAVSVTIDIEAISPGGFDEKTVCVVKENAATLKFKTAEFETD